MLAKDKSTFPVKKTPLIVFVGKLQMLFLKKLPSPNLLSNELFCNIQLTGDVPIEAQTIERREISIWAFFNQIRIVNKRCDPTSFKKPGLGEKIQSSQKSAFASLQLKGVTKNQNLRKPTNL